MQRSNIQLANEKQIIQHANAQRMSTQRAMIYDALCMVLSDRGDQIAWESFNTADWDLFERMAVAEGVGPLIHWMVKHANVQTCNGFHSRVPYSTLNLLAQEYYKTAARNALLFKELERILAALSEAGIPVIVLKGAALARTLYPEPALRPMNDLDLLVQGDDLLAAIKILESLHYRKMMVSWHLLMRGGPKSQVPVEVHWQLLREDPDENKLSADWFWRNAALIPGTQSTKAFLLGAQLMYLSAHMLDKHTGARLVWLYDVHIMIKKKFEPLAWEVLTQEISETAWHTLICQTLSLARKRLGTILPEPVNESLKNHALDEEKLFRQYSYVHSRTRLIHVWRAINKLSWRTRLLLARDLFFPNTNYIAWRYNPKPAWLWPFYYPYRWLEIGRHGGSNLQDLKKKVN